MKPGDVVRWRAPNGPENDHVWKVLGVHLGALGVESLVHIENISHKPGWTGEWETHVMMFVPECLLRQCEVMPAKGGDND
jgi:hypothetical protein